MLDGEYNIANGALEHRLAYGDVYFFNSPDTHKIERISPEGMLITIHIDLNYYSNRFLNYDGSGTYNIVQRKSSGGEGLTDDRMYRISNYVDHNAEKKITLEDIASKEYLSPNYLSTYIKKAMGLSFSELLSVIRCEHAETLLGMTSNNLDEIAAKTGFSNRSHLTNQFRKWFDKTPSEYRRELKQDLASDSIRYDTFDYDYAMMIINSYLDGY